MHGHDSYTCGAVQCTYIIVAGDIIADFGGRPF